MGIRDEEWVVGRSGGWVGWRDGIGWDRMG